MKNDNKIVQPFGRVAKRIIVEADDKGMIRVNAFDIPLVIVKAGQATPMVPMDSREMVLGLLKVVSDYTSALFNMTVMKGSPTDAKQESSSEGPQSQNN